ncbi:MAG: hypothetical protein HRT45_11910 [Bdellovibrionales bacterium]|nr:hypothetical protein [Bdellovibrionales bacterium]
MTFSVVQKSRAICIASLVFSSLSLAEVIERQNAESLLIGEGQVTIADSEIKKKIDEKKYRIEATLDLISGEDNSTDLREPQNNSVRQAVIGLNYELSDEYQAYIQIASPTFNDESDMFVSLAYVTYTTARFGLEVDLGQTFYPVGLLTANDFYFLAQPFYYTEFYKGKRGLDVGFHLKFQPFSSLPLIFEAACFQGQVFRGSDSRSEVAERSPCTQVLGLKGEHYNLALQRFEHDLAFFDPVLAEGVSFQGQTPTFFKRMSLGLWAEYFRIRVDQEQGPQTVNAGGFAYPFIDLRPVRLGYRYGSTQNRTRLANGQEVGTRVLDEVLRFEYRPTDFLSFVYEDHVAFQESGVGLEDQWAVRMLLDFQL